MDVLKTQPSFRAHLTTIVTIGVVVLAVTASLTTAWVTSNNLYDVLVEDGVLVSESLADQSVLALLYGSGENAEDAVRVALSFPSVEHVMIITSEFQIILSEGNLEPDLTKVEWVKEGASLVSDEIDRWVFVAPVYSGNDFHAEESALLLQQATSHELIGYVVVTKKKDKLREIQAVTVFNNLGIGLLIAVIMVIILRNRFDRLTKPLNELSDVMGKAEQGDANAYARLYGPREVVQIARAFNKMMEALADRDQQLRNHNEQLETEVALRTQELVYARDVAIQANKNKSEFLANITHELRTPLQAIIGYGDLISETVPEDDMELHHDLECIQNNAQNLLGMINEILDLSKVESGRMDVNIQKESIPRIVKQTADTVRQLMEKNRNKFTVTVEKCDQPIEIDGVKLRQIILNLLSNAGKFTEDGAVIMNVWQNEHQLMILVSDTGIGIRAEALKIIFDPFRQVDGSDTRKFEGTGLGLAITKKFCQLMGGNVTVTSELGKGSEFIVNIPLPVKKT